MTIGKYIDYHFGSEAINGHVDAVHAVNPRSDKFTGAIVNGIVKRCNSPAIVSTVSRTVMDLNRDRSDQNRHAIDEYRHVLRQLIIHKRNLRKDGQLRRNHLHVAIHGMANRWKSDIELGTRHGQICSEPIFEWFLEHVRSYSRSVGINNHFPGHRSIGRHRFGDPYSTYKGYGDLFHSIQVEVSFELRAYDRLRLIRLFSNIITAFDQEFN